MNIVYQNVLDQIKKGHLETSHFIQIVYQMIKILNLIKQDFGKKIERYQWKVNCKS